MTTCQRCAGNLKYQIMAYDGHADTPVTIEKTCEPCINNKLRSLELEAEFLLIDATEDPLAPARGTFIPFLIGVLFWLLAGAIIYGYYQTH